MQKTYLDVVSYVALVFLFKVERTQNDKAILESMSPRSLYLSVSR